MKTKNVKAEEYFFLAPPLVSKRGYGFSVIQLGRNFSETMILRMNEWSSRAFLAFWFNELMEILEGARVKGLLPCGIYRDEVTGEFKFGERWEVFRCGNEFAFHDRTVVFENDLRFLSSARTKPSDWWRLISDYERVPLRREGDDVEYESEWRVSARAVADWCHKYSCVFVQMDNVDSDVEFSW